MSDHLNGNFDCFGLGGVAVGTHLAMLVSIGASSTDNIKMESLHVLKRGRGRPVPWSWRYITRN
jgi:hypothetical protein